MLKPQFISLIFSIILYQASVVESQQHCTRPYITNVYPCTLGGGSQCEQMQPTCNPGQKAYDFGIEIDVGDGKCTCTTKVCSFYPSSSTPIIILYLVAMLSKWSPESGLGPLLFPYRTKLHSTCYTGPAYLFFYRLVYR